MKKHFWWLRWTLDRLGIALPVDEPAQPDVIAYAVEALMDDAAERPTGDLLVVADTLHLVLPAPEYTYWLPMQRHLKDEIDKQVTARARRALRRLQGGRLLQGGTEVTGAVNIRLVLLPADDAQVNAVVMHTGSIATPESSPGLTCKPDDVASLLQEVSAPTLCMTSRGKVIEGRAAVRGLQIGRHPARELRVPDEYPSVSRVAATVLSSTANSVTIRVDNQFDAWLQQPDGNSIRRIPCGREATIAPGQWLALDESGEILVGIS